MGVPQVSVVTATFNRSNVLRFTIESVLRSTFSDWEMIVVGDACTDDTDAVVASYADSRIRFVNLDVNHGEQSGPNNAGVRLARGKYIAFLNHDDLWTTDHLQRGVAELDRGEAPFVHTMCLIVPPDGRPVLGGATRSGDYEPYAVSPASTWLMRRELPEQVGPWRPARSLFVIPSADWLHRAWKQGIVMKTIPAVTVLCIKSGGRSRTYAERQEAENRQWADRLRDDPDFLREQLTAAAARASIDELSIRHALRCAARSALYRMTVACGFHPTLLRALTYGRRGSLLDHLRKTRGLAPLPRKVTS